MPYKLSQDGKSVLVYKNGKWKTLKRHPNKQRARSHLVALKLNTKE